MFWYAVGRASHIHSGGPLPGQLDMLVEMKAGQFDVSIVIDCKDYKEPVDIKGVEVFIAMIEDLGVTKPSDCGITGLSPLKDFPFTMSGVAVE